MTTLTYDEEGLITLLCEDDPCFVTEVAIDPNTPVQTVLDIIPLVGESGILEEIAQMSTHPLVLTALAEHPLGHARHFAGANESTPADTLDLMIADPLPVVRLSVAKNVSTSEEALRFLAEDENAFVRATAKRALARK